MTNNHEASGSNDPLDDDLVAEMEAVNMNNEVEEKMLALERVRDREPNYDYRRDSGMGIFPNQDVHPFDITALPDDIEETILNMSLSNDLGASYAAAFDEQLNLMNQYDALNIRGVVSQSQENYDKFNQEVLKPLLDQVKNASRKTQRERSKYIMTQNVIRERLAKKAEYSQIMRQLQRRRMGNFE